MSSNDNDWSCNTCTFINNHESQACSICGSQPHYSTHFNCICNADLTFTTAAIYGPNRTVYCNICNNELAPNELIFHCDLQHTYTHPNGYDLCCDCSRQKCVKSTDFNLDSEVFKNETNAIGEECNGHKHCTQCISIKRLLTALKYYSMLNIFENENDRDSFHKFINDTYYQLIDDYIHLINHHSHELETINNDIINNNIICDISKCSFTARHHKQLTETNKNELDPTLNFWKNTMDSLHFYLLHCFDVGLRTKNNNSNDEKQLQTEEQKDGKYFDTDFARMSKAISERKYTTKSLSKKNDKFNIKLSNELKEDLNNSKTFSDSLYQHLQQNDVVDIVITKLNVFVNQQEYDTECIEDDIIDTDQSNIMRYIRNFEIIQTIKDLFTVTKVSWSILSGSFSIGFRFYYWKYYKTQKYFPNERDHNKNDHSGYEICDLYIAPQYGSFKEEISNYAYVSREQYGEVIEKMNKYIIATFVKKTKAARTQHKYGIEEGALLTYSHLLSLVFYCDYGELSSAFSSSFRRINRFETIDGVKKRNEKFFHLSKYLRETVECYGQCSRYSPRLSGPFYCGMNTVMNTVMNMPAFNIRLCAPTSTTMQIEVAIKFSTEEGIIIQFNNPDRKQYSQLRGFNVSWISRYKEEDERLFVGGYYYIKIQSVRVRKTKNNYEDIIYSLSYLDTILTGGSTYDIKVRTKDILAIKHLFNRQINKAQRMAKVDDYIYDTFASFIHNKTQISLDLWRLDQSADSQMLGLIMHPLSVDINSKVDSDFSNLLRTEMFKIFKNVNTLIIRAGQIGAQYSISMIRLLSLIESGSLDKVIVKTKTARQNNWIYSLWCVNGEMLQKQYRSKDYRIRMEDAGHKGCWFLINKKT